MKIGFEILLGVYKGKLVWGVMVDLWVLVRFKVLVSLGFDINLN